MAEYMRGLAVTTGERTTAGDLHIAFRPGKWGVCIESYAGIGRFIKMSGCHTGNFCIAVTFYLCEKPGKREFSFTDNHIIGIFRYFTGTRRCMRTTTIVMLSEEEISCRYWDSFMELRL